jgi:hypothetical protein
VVCEFCGARVEISAANRLQEELSHVDQWWERLRRPLMTQDRHGRLHPPEEHVVLYTVLMVVGGVLGMMAFFGGHSLGSSLVGIGGFFLFPILITLPAAMLHERNERRYKEYKKLEAEYEARRSAIIESYARRA